LKGKLTKGEKRVKSATFEGSRRNQTTVVRAPNAQDQLGDAKTAQGSDHQGGVTCGRRLK